MHTIRGWAKARKTLEHWRRELIDVQVALERPRVIEMIPVDFSTGEPVTRRGAPRKSFKAKLIFVTEDDVTLRRASGALLVIDTYELASLSDGRTRVVP